MPILFQAAVPDSAADRAFYAYGDCLEDNARQFAAAGLPYFNPHSLRDTLVQLGEQVCTTPEQFKAWSQNLGHERVMTTLTSYGTVAPHRQAELIRGMSMAMAQGAAGPADVLDLAFAAKVLDAMRRVSAEGP